MTRNEYDVIVIGGGSAGSAAAAEAAANGARTLMVNDGELGGLCILRGCMPTKSMLEAAHAAHHAAHTEPFGVTVDARPRLDFGRVMQRKDEHVARFQRAKVAAIESDDYEVLDGRARFVDERSIEVDGQRFSASGYVIATGSTPIIPKLPGIEDVPVLTSDDVMQLTRRPDRLLAMGGGPIGLELALFFARAGSEVTLVARSPLLHRCDPEAGAELTRVLEDEPRFRLLAPGAIEALEPRGGGLRARLRCRDEHFEVDADSLLVAAGRRADLDGLGLEHLGLEPVGGALEHDAGMRSLCQRVWVAGDATGRHQILHLSTLEGRVAGHNAAGAAPGRSVDYRVGIQVVFTDPPYAQVGMTLDGARQAGIDVVVGSVRLPETGRAITMETRHGLWSIFAERSSGEILGASILGPRADDLAHIMALLVHQRASAADVLEMPWYHPTLSEVILNAAREVERARS